MEQEKLMKYDFDSITSHLEVLNKKVHRKTLGRIGQVTITIDSVTNKIRTMSTIDKEMLFKLLIVVAAECFPLETRDEIHAGIEKALEGTGISFTRLIDELIKTN